MNDFDIGMVLEDTNTNLAQVYVEAFRDYLLAVVLKNAPQTRAARLRLEGVVSESMARAEVLGAFSTLREASEVLAPETNFKAERQSLMSFARSEARSILAKIPFEESLEDLVNRVPVTLRESAARTASKISSLYSDNGGVIAFARSAEDAVTQRAHELITQGAREGITEREMGKTMAFDVNRIRKETEAWTEGYARMAFRTNLNEAASRGRLRQAQDPEVKEVIPAMRFTSVGDADTRSNHDAADGVVLSVDNPSWRFLRPPLGFNCRCQLDFISRPELRRMGLIDKAGKVIETRIPSSARPDQGFTSQATT